MRLGFIALLCAAFVWCNQRDKCRTNDCSKYKASQGKDKYMNGNQACPSRAPRLSETLFEYAPEHGPILTQEQTESRHQYCPCKTASTGNQNKFLIGICFRSATSWMPCCWSRGVNQWWCFNKWRRNRHLRQRLGAYFNSLAAVRAFHPASWVFCINGFHQSAVVAR